MDELANANGEGVDFYVFSLSTDPLWESFQSKIAEFVNIDNNSGNATILEPSKNRPNWVQVKDVLNGSSPISDLGCD